MIPQRPFLNFSTRFDIDIRMDGAINLTLCRYIACSFYS